MSKAWFNSPNPLIYRLERGQQLTDRAEASSYSDGLLLTSPVHFFVHDISSLTPNVVVSWDDQKPHPLRDGKNIIQTLQEMKRTKGEVK